MAVDLATAERHRDMWLATDKALSRNKSYTQPDGRTVTRADQEEVDKALGKWQRAVNELTAQAAGQPDPGVKVATWR